MFLSLLTAAAFASHPDPVLGTRPPSFYGFFVIVGLLGLALTLTSRRNSEHR
ncbi:MAG: hypothetical protein QG626_212 [Patescibacteria group bacterium]|jgi:hypothetical protein|nr:hypothetical protein [Patescibacteria group bacterium]